MTTDEVNEDELFTALVKHRLSGIDPKYVPDDAVANIADAYTEWRSRVERAAAEKAWWEACLRIADGENNLDIADTYQKQNPYLEGIRNE